MRILLISGSTRAGSSNSATLRTAHAVAPPGVTTVLYDGLSALPHFNADDDPSPPPSVVELRAAIADADALVLCVPEYAGTLPGSFKNLLDWTIGGTEISGKPIAWVNVAMPSRGEGAIATLRVVLGYVTAQILEECCRRIWIKPPMVGADGLVADPTVRTQLTELLADVARATRRPTRSNTRMDRWLAQAQGGAPAVPAEFRALVAAGIRPMQRWWFFAAKVRPEWDGRDELGPQDETGVECSTNDVYLSAILDEGTTTDAPALATTALACAHHLARALRATNGRPFRIIVSVREDGTGTLRFHKLREGEAWLHPDLESFLEEGIFELDVA